jgi:hypothetical protein
MLSSVPSLYKIDKWMGKLMNSAHWKYTSLKLIFVTSEAAVGSAYCSTNHKHIVMPHISQVLKLKKSSNLEIYKLSWPVLQGQQHAFLEVTQHTPCHVEIWENIIHVHFIRCALPKVWYKSWKLCFASRSSSTIISQGNNIGLPERRL